MVETAVALIIGMDKRGRITFFNKKCEEVTGYSRQEVLGKIIFTLLIPKKEQTSFRKVLRSLVEDNFPSHFISNWVTKDGDLRTIEWNNTIIADEKAKAREIFGIGFDITEPKQREARLKESEEKYRTLVEQSLQGLLIFSFERFPPHVVFANQACSRILGYDIKEILAFSPEEIFAAIHPEDRERALELARNRQKSANQPRRYEFRITHKDGTLHWIDVFATAINYQGFPAAQVAIVDSTERKNAEARYLSLFDSVPVGLYRTTLDGRILEANKALVEMLGFPDRESLLARKATDFYVIPGDRERTRAMLDNVDIVRGFETQLRRLDDTIIWVRDNFRGIKDEQGKVLFHEGSLEEITESKWLQEAYYEVVEHSIQGLIIIQDYRIVFSNKAMADMLGYSVEEILAWTPEEVKGYVHPEDQSRVWSRYENRLAGKEEPKRYEFRAIRKDGNIIWVEVFAARIEYHGKPAIQAAYLNVSERKQAEKALRESEERYRLLFERVSDVICVLDLEGKILNISPAVETDYGYKPDELIGKTFQEVGTLAPEYLEKAISEFRQLLAGDTLVRPVYELISKDGTRRVGEMRSALMRKDGEVFAVVVAIRDITERQRAEEALRASEEKSRAQYKAIPVPTYTWQHVGDDFVLVDFNDAALAITKGKISDYLGIKVREMYKDNPEILREIMRCFTEKTSFEQEMRYKYLSTREEKHLAVKYAFVPPDLVLIHTEDITDRKQAEEALQASEAQQRALLKAIPDLMFQINKEGIFLSYKALHVEDLYTPPDQFLRKSIFDVLPEEVAHKTMYHLEQAFLTQELQRFEYQLPVAGGLQDWEARLVVSGEDTVLVIVRNITERKQVENILREARSRAEFLVDLMGHDLNNINQGILLNLEILLQDPTLPNGLEERILAAINQVDRSAELIMNVKRFQSLDTEPVRLDRKDPFLALVAAVDAVKRTFPHKKLTVKTNLREGEYWIQADGFLTELFFNLLHNAMKFDRRERVLIDVRAGLTRDKGALKVQIKDRGPGILDSEKERIFSRFPREQEGVRTSGIGLTLVHRIILRYGGQIWVEDRIRGDHTKGANFVILFRRRESA
ncbi:MAG: PAS domain S-box protein [Promethearchaeota archaeon]